jgi:predicted enzyme related to lactoylglutathione lyase
VKTAAGCKSRSVQRERRWLKRPMVARELREPSNVVLDGKKGNLKMAVHYLEIVSNDVDALTALYQRMHGLSFGPPDPDLGQARVATQADGSLVGIRKPLAAHEQPIMRTYLAVEDIQQAVKEAEHVGAAIAYPPTGQGQRGTFAIVIQGDVQHGLWQR